VRGGDVQTATALEPTSKVDQEIELFRKRSNAESPSDSPLATKFNDFEIRIPRAQKGLQSMSALGVPAWFVL